MYYRRLVTLVCLATFLAVAQNVQACWHHRHCNCHNSSGSSYTGQAPVNRTPVANNVSMQFAPATYFVPAMGVVSNGTQNQGVERGLLSSVGTIKEILGILNELGTTVAPSSSGLEGRVSKLETSVERNRVDISELQKSQQEITNRIDNELAALKTQLESGSGNAEATVPATSASDQLIEKVSALKRQRDGLMKVVEQKRRRVAMFSTPAPTAAEDKIILEEAQAELKKDEAELDEITAEYTPLYEQFLKLAQ